jgi:hypothetical protein
MPRSPRRSSCAWSVRELAYPNSLRPKWCRYRRLRRSYHLVCSLVFRPTLARLRLRPRIPTAPRCGESEMAQGTNLNRIPIQYGRRHTTMQCRVTLIKVVGIHWQHCSATVRRRGGGGNGGKIVSLSFALPEECCTRPSPSSKSLSVSLASLTTGERGAGWSPRMTKPRTGCSLRAHRFEFAELPSFGPHSLPPFPLSRMVPCTARKSSKWPIPS